MILYISIKHGIRTTIQNNWASILAVSVAVIAGVVAIVFANQPLLEAHDFRQTQTAITSYWIIREGWKLAYQTPIAGYPWSIPFEFPIYQLIVAFIVYFFKFSMDATGRLVSFIFLISCYFPALTIARKLKLDKQVVYVFCALLWSSPIYLFWGRTFMIETTAVFFALMVVSYAIDFFDSTPGWKSVFLLSIFSTLGLLQKITTTAPVLIVLSIVILISHLKSIGIKLPTLRKIISIAIAIVIPFVIAILWTNYTDFIKSQNPLGANLTSKALADWNFGTLQQKIDPNVFKKIFWDRIFSKNAFGYLGLAVLVYSFFQTEKRIKLIMIISLIMFISPILIFTNLHYVHDYYQVASTLFLLSALAIAIVFGIPQQIGKFKTTPVVVVSFVLYNLFHFSIGYAGQMIIPRLDNTHSRIMAISDVIRRYTEKESGIVVFGNDWSSTIGYYSERKSFTVPNWYKNYESVWNNPERHLGPRKLGAVIFFVNDYNKNISDILERTDIKLDPSLFKVMDSFVWLPGINSINLPNSNEIILPMNLFEKVYDSIPADYTYTSTLKCGGSIETINGITPISDNVVESNYLTVDGWLTYSAKDTISTDDIFVTLKSTSGKTKYISTNRKPRYDINKRYFKPFLGDVGYNASIDMRALKGKYILGLAFGYKGKLVNCEQFNYPVSNKTN